MKVTLRVDYRREEIRWWPAVPMIAFPQREGRVFHARFRFLWRIAKDELKRGHRVVIAAKPGEANYDLFDPEIVLRRNRKHGYAADSGFPRREPTWQGHQDPCTGQWVWDDGYVPSCPPDREPRFDRRVVGAYEQRRAEADALVEANHGRLQRIARFTYAIEVRDRKGGTVLCVDPDGVLAECP